MKGEIPTLKAQDVLVLLKLVAHEEPTWTFEHLGDCLGLSNSEVLQSVRRLENAGLADSERRAVLKDATTEFLVHAVKFLFPAPANGSGATPLYKTAPYAASRDPRLTKLLALLDAIRVKGMTLNKGQAETLLVNQVSEYLESARTRPPKEVVLANLSDQGAPLVLSKQSAGIKKDLPAEKTVAWSLAYSHEDPTLARVLPVVLYKQRNVLNFRFLRQWAKTLHEERTLGFFLELTSELSHDRSLWKKARAFRANLPAFSELDDFFHTDSSNPWSDKLLNQKTPDVAKRWGFKMNMGLETFASHFRKFT
jgi:hypothetical protein